MANRRWSCSRADGVGRKTAPSTWPCDFFAKEAVMECDICGEDVENSEELHKHKEQAHAEGVGDKSVENLERPDMLGYTPEESAAVEIPKPTH